MYIAQVIPGFACPSNLLMVVMGRPSVVFPLTLKPSIRRPRSGASQIEGAPEGTVGGRPHPSSFRFLASPRISYNCWLSA